MEEIMKTKGMIVTVLAVYLYGALWLYFLYPILSKHFGIRALYWANQKGDMLSLNLFAKSISNAFFEEAMGITEKKLNEANVYQGPYDAMYDAGHQHGDFF